MYIDLVEFWHNSFSSTPNGLGFLYLRLLQNKFGVNLQEDLEFFFFLKAFSWGGVTACCMLMLNFAPFLQDPCQFNQTKQAQAAPMFWILQHPPQFQRLYRVSLQDSKHLRTFIVVCKTAVCHGCSCDEDSCATAVWKGSCFWGGQWCRHLTRYQPHTTGKGNTKSQQSSMDPWVFFVLFVWKNGNVWGCKYENYVRTGRYPKCKNVFW